ncbi:MAG: IS200/IS605 family transposase [Planctomycetales bacterium]|nr:IS200/IS605 family transposase [Planctomycetales bacterium]
MPGTHTNLLYHLVFSTKKRLPMITDAIEAELYKYLGGIVRGEGGILLEVGGMPDHVHLLVKLKPTIAVSDMLRLLKANSSKWVNEEKLKYRKFGWQDGYAAFTASQSQGDKVTKYIRNQKQHHRTRDFKTEFVALLERHEVEYEKRYLWD